MYTRVYSPQKTAPPEDYGGTTMRHRDTMEAEPERQVESERKAEEEAVFATHGSPESKNEEAIPSPPSIEEEKEEAPLSDTSEEPAPFREPPRFYESLQKKEGEPPREHRWDPLWGDGRERREEVRREEREAKEHEARPSAARAAWTEQREERPQERRAVHAGEDDTRPHAEERGAAPGGFGTNDLLLLALAALFFQDGAADNELLVLLLFLLLSD